MLVVLVISASALLMVAPFASATDRQFAQSDDISVSPSRSDIALKAGESTMVYLDIHNLLPKGSSDDPNTLVVYIYYDGSDTDIKVTFPQGNRVEIEGEELSHCEINVEVWRYARSTEHEVSFDIYINDPDRGFPIKADASDTVRISVHSDLSSENYFNKIMGLWENNLPAPFNEPWFTALFSFMIWILIAIIVAYGVLPLITDRLKVGKAKEDVKGGDKP